MYWTIIQDTIADYSSTIINIISLVLGGLGGAAGQWVISFYKERKAQDISSNDQAVQIYRELYEKMLADLKRLEQTNDVLEKAYFVEKEDNFKLRNLKP